MNAMSFLFGAVWVLAVAASSAAEIAQTSAPNVVSEQTLMPLGVILTVVGATWWLSARVARYEARIAQAEQAIHRQQQHLDQIDRLLRKIDRALDHLPRTPAPGNQSCDLDDTQGDGGLPPEGDDL